MDWLPFPGGRTAGSGMGHFRVSVQVGRRGGERFARLDALVDTGSTYTWVPRDMLQLLGVTAEEQWPFELANGREVRYPVAWAEVRISGGEHTSELQSHDAGAGRLLVVVT